ncbi:MAG: ABC transporter permease [Filimonas sp.]|nr:ABC transporter permease [Filimonas sp.]
MFKNYLKVALRNLRKNKSISLINIVGLSVGMAVALLIGLWIWDEVSYDKYHQHYDRIAQVRQNQTFNGEISTGQAIPVPLGEELRKTYGSDFKHIVLSSWTWNHILTVGDKKIKFTGNYMEPEAPEMLTLNMVKGARNGLKDQSSILLAASVAKALFGNEDPMNKTVLVDNKDNFKVTGVYEDLPYNTSLNELLFILPWSYYMTQQNPNINLHWGNNSFQLYVQVNDNADMQKVSQRIRDAKYNRVDADTKAFNPRIFLQPMSDWHLRSEYKNGVLVGGRIQYVWLFGIIGIFVLLLACINFMNLSTARSEQRAKEVGIRKAVGSLRGDIIRQFFIESILMALFAFVFALVLARLILPFFNSVADKRTDFLWTNPVFWLIGIGFTLFTGLVAGSYPALYLSSFQPVKVLKGTFKAGRFAALPRKVLVVLQFSVSIILIIGTIVVFKQIQFAKDRPVGYNRNGLLYLPVATEDLHKNFAPFKNDLIASGVVSNMAESSSNPTEVTSNNSGFQWPGKPPGMTDDFATIRITPEYGNTIGWQFVGGRDFYAEDISDSNSVVLNEKAVKYMGLKNPVGQAFMWDNEKITVIGVVKDMVMQSPYEPVKQTIFYMNPKRSGGNMLVRVNPNVSMAEALSKIEAICKKYSPAEPFSYKFVDDQYSKKFGDEERIGKLASFFAILAVFISCLGLFGMATFMAEQRTKEIGVRKVLGASVFNLWGLLSKDFVILVIVATLIAIPLSYYLMHNWLQHYTYRSGLAWWIFALTAFGAMLITLLTVSYQSIKAALMNPVKSLRTE